MKREKLALRSFWSVHKDVAALVLNAKDVEKIFAQEGSWQPIADILASVVDSSVLGMKMFGWLLGPVLDERMQIFTDQCIDDSLRGEVTKQKVTKCVNVCLDEAARLGAVSALREKRDITISYRGTQLLVKDVRGYEEELMLRLAAKLKSMCAGAGVPLLIFESSVLGEPETESEGENKVDPELLHDYVMARRTANEMLKDQVLSGDLVKEMLNSKGQICLQVDKTFKLEMALLDTACGQGGVARMQTLVLEALPSATRPMTMQRAQQQLAMLSQQAHH
jgi:hypothetical protein